MLLERNFLNLARKVSDGDTLTAAEIKFLEDQEKGKTEGVSLDDSLTCPNFAQNQSQLAEYLGVSRQLVSWHLRKAGSPGRRPDGRYSVAAWRDHFAAHGRVDVQRRRSTKTVSKLNFGDGVYTALESIGERLPHLLRESLSAAGVKASDQKTNLASVMLFSLCAKVAESVATRWGFDPFFDDDTAWPEAIVEAAKSCQPKTRLPIKQNE